MLAEDAKRQIYSFLRVEEIKMPKDGQMWNILLERDYGKKSEDAREMYKQLHKQSRKDVLTFVITGLKNNFTFNTAEHVVKDSSHRGCDLNELYEETLKDKYAYYVEENDHIIGRDQDGEIYKKGAPKGMDRLFWEKMASKLCNEVRGEKPKRLFGKNVTELCVVNTTYFKFGKDSYGPKKSIELYSLKKNINQEFREKYWGKVLFGNETGITFYDLIVAYYYVKVSKFIDWYEQFDKVEDYSFEPLPDGKKRLVLQISFK